MSSDSSMQIVEFYKLRLAYDITSDIPPTKKSQLPLYSSSSKTVLSQLSTWTNLVTTTGLPVPTCGHSVAILFIFIHSNFRSNHILHPQQSFLPSFLLPLILPNYRHSRRRKPVQCSVNTLLRFFVKLF
ncbi:unnamed protein product [Citrullus colocynthis]|uniref:Uncharacterized protein n=1 Tax=Citrullus colocynthis TaxID=252529 RepID=A0ABP0YQS3_9ROSI